MTLPDRLSGLLVLLFALFVIRQAWRLPYWHEQAPGPGFVPLWLGILMAAAAVALLLRPRARRARDETAAWPARRDAIRLVVVVLLAVGAAVVSAWTGLVTASGLLMAAALFYLRPGRHGSNVAIALAVAFVVWLIFIRWLAVPLPVGPFGF